MLYKPSMLKLISKFVDDAGGWAGRARTDARGRVALGWRDAHDYIASTLFDLVSLTGGLQGPWSQQHGKMASLHFSMAGPAEVLAAALAEDGGRRSWPGAVPDACFTVDARVSTIVTWTCSDIF